MVSRLIITILTIFSIVQTTCQAQDKSIVVAHWNIGHFSLGKSHQTRISAEKGDSMALVYHTLIDSINADIFGVCEYSSLFSHGGLDASNTIFSDFAYKYIGNNYGFACNAIFSKIALENPYQHKYMKRFRNAYYVISTIQIDSIKVKYVETHLEWQKKEDGTTNRTAQIEELIDILAPYPYVIIAGDFNTNKGMKEYDPFVDAGYSLAISKEDLQYTYPAQLPRSAIDNIIVKGFDIDNTRVWKKERLSDHCLLQCTLKPKLPAN